MDNPKKIFGVEPKAPAKDEPEIVDFRGNRSYGLAVVGETSFQHNLSQICGPRKEEGESLDVTARLVLDDHDPNDKNAVRVEVNGLQVGHLSRRVAALYRERLRKGGHPDAIGECRARIIGGWDRDDGDFRNYGVWLDMPSKG